MWKPYVVATTKHKVWKLHKTAKLSVGYQCENHKRTQQGVSAELLSYLYKLHIVCATNNYSCSNVYILSMSVLYVHYEVAI